MAGSDCHSGADLRDPKLITMPNGDLMLLAYARFADEHNRGDGRDHLGAATRVKAGRLRVILARVIAVVAFALVNHTAFGLAYNRTEQRLDLYSGNPFGTLSQCNNAGQVKHKLGYPNESDLLLASDNSLYALVRRDADTCTAHWLCQTALQNGNI